MNPKAVAVCPLPDYQLDVVFANGGRRIFDVRPYLEHGVFRQLKDTEQFSAVRVVAGAVEWPGEIDLSYDTLYVEGAEVRMVDHKLSLAP